ncbi:hypothetical protein [Nocardia pseudovaccinii]|uniref:hypothetical protein n=1 Tax=Nocardia pseudovaccinii TaxID=189540 RepID=UPI0007A54ADC|nr:hypothetical protein [Nocardia pseudovaccinii]
MPRRKEKSSELRARAVLEHALGVELELVEPDPSGPPSPDYRLCAPEAAFEVKEFASQDWKGLGKAVNKAPVHTPLSRLSGVWGCLVPAYNAVEELELGEPGSARQPRVKRLPKDLVGPLEVLERHSVTDYRIGIGAVSEELRQACERIGWLLRGGWCTRFEFEGEPPFSPGVVVLGLGWGHSRTGDPDVFADLVQMWLDRRSANMRESLDGVPGEHHGVLVVAESVVGEARAVEDMRLEFLPVVSLRLPVEIDTLWVVIGSMWLRFDEQTGVWTNGSITGNPLPDSTIPAG